MNSIATGQPAVLPSQVSATLRFATAVAVAAVLALAWVVAEQASHQAVQTATAAFSRGAGQPVQPAVAMAGHRATTAKRS